MAVKSVVDYIDRDFVSNFNGRLEAFTENRKNTNVKMKGFEVSIEDARPFRGECALDRRALLSSITRVQ